MDKPRPSLIEQSRRYNALEMIRTDPRFTNGHSTRAARDYIEAAFWAAWETAHLPHGEERNIAANRRIRAVLGRWDQLTSDSLHRQDVPRYEPDTRRGLIGCDHALASGPRRGESCGRSSSLTFRITDPSTGRWRLSGWCNSHKTAGWSAREEESVRDKSSDPVPAPNRGGVLPCYLKVRDGLDWVDVYRSVAFPGWEPPKFGVVASEWPNTGEDWPKPRLQLLTVDADWMASPTEPVDWTKPRLTVV